MTPAAEPRSPATMRLLGGLPVLDFVNTVDSRIGRWGPDLLTDYANLLVWSGRLRVLDASEVAALEGVAAASPSAAAQALQRAKDLREAMFGVFSGAAHGQSPKDEDFALLAGEARHGLARRTLAAQGSRFAWQWSADDGLDAPTLRLAVEAADLLIDPSRLGRVKQCKGPNCGWLFIDETRNGRRRWCSDETCGVHSRVKRFRGKRNE